MKWTVAPFVLALIVGAVPSAKAQTAENVAVVINGASPESKEIGEYYVRARNIPAENVFRIETVTTDVIEPAAFVETIQQPIAAALFKGNLQDRVLYIVLTKGVPLRIAGTAGQDGTVASVDSELTLLYRRMAAGQVPTRGRIENPYFLGGKAVADARLFSHREHDIYLVSRLDGFTVADAKALVDRAQRTVREGRVVLDQRDALVNRLGEDWLGLAAQNLTKAGHGERVLLEATPKPARDVSPVMGYFSWGSTDPQNRVRKVQMDFVPGAIGGSYVSTDARSFKEPPAGWMPTNTAEQSTWFSGSPQSLVGDLIREGITGVAGQVSEPYLQSAVRPDVLFPAYLAGFNLVEAFYLAIPHLSWQTVVIGDPLCSPFVRRPLARGEIDGGLDADLRLPAFFGKRRLASVMATMPGAPEAAARLAVRAEAAFRENDRAAGRRLLEQATDLAPNAARLQILLADWYTSVGELEAAADRWGKVLALQPNNVVALNNLAYDMAVRQKKPAEALPLARKALSLSGGDANVLDTVGWIEHLSGNSAEAARILVQAAKGAPRNADVRLHNAVVLAAQGARGAAAAELAEALKLKPTLAEQPETQALQAQLQLRSGQP
jgi:uncharacterized protein (TIGR03790 family)